MQSAKASIFVRTLLLALVAGLFCGPAASSARAEALLLVDTDSGRVLHAENAGYPWYPASVTKIMTTYVTLRAVKDGRIKLDSLIAVSENALAQQPSKMGFPVGTKLTVDHALKMLMVRSANDIAVVIAEGVSGSVEAFAAEMNKASQRLGMTQSTWVNPHGLPDDGQVTSARDMAILARAIIREFPQHDIYWRAPSIRFGRRIMRNYNRLIGRYAGADGMKTGFICASGYNLVATASRNGKRMIAVVLGASSGTQRAEVAARLLEKGFGGNTLSWLMPSLGTVDALQPIAAAPPNLREEICGKGRRNRTDHAEEEQAQNGPPSALGVTAFASTITGFQSGTDQAPLLGPLVELPPVPVTVIAPPGSSANPEALLHNPRKKKRGRATVGAGKGKGRKSAVIDVSAPPKKDAPAAAASRKKKAAPAQAKAAPKANTKKTRPARPAAAKGKAAAAPAAAQR